MIKLRDTLTIARSHAVIRIREMAMVRLTAGVSPG
jgi:hypothetical protein